MEELLSGTGLTALGTVILIDIVMSGDNAIVIGMAAAGLEPRLRRKAIIIGIATAAGLRATLASVTVQLLSIIGLTLAGGILLLWVAWKMWREVRTSRQRASAAEGAAANGVANAPRKKTLHQALLAIIVADVSMSLDNVLAVAGAAKENLVVLVTGLALSIALMGVASNYIARLLERYHWIAYLGLAVVLYVAVEMIYRGTAQVVQSAT